MKYLFVIESISCTDIHDLESQLAKTFHIQCVIFIHILRADLRVERQQM